MSWNLNFETMPNNEGAHVLTLKPFWVPVMLQFSIFISRTCSFGAFPRLPILMPCPGPHETYDIVTFLVPSIMDMQSSPVAITDCEILMSWEAPRRMPSVFGLSAGAINLTLLILMLLHAKKLKWAFLLFNDLRWWILEFLTKSNLIVW